MSSISTLHELKQLSQEGIRFGASWSDDPQGKARNHVETVCTMLDANYDTIAVVEHSTPLSPDASTQHHRYYSSSNVPAHQTFTTLPTVNPNAAALYYSVYAPSGQPLSKLPGGCVTIDVFGPFGNTLGSYDGTLDYGPCQGLVVGALLRVDESTWRGVHVELPVELASSADMLEQTMQAHMHGLLS